jgi:2'-5' RNA ligase
MSRSTAARLFVAVDPPPDVREQLAAWARLALGPSSRGGRGASRPLRLLEPELLHLTLCFLGSRPVEEIQSIVDALAACAEHVDELSIGAPLWLPARHPRVLAVEVHDPSGELGRLHAAVIETIAAATGWRPQGDDREGGKGAGHRRGFHPHVTLARMSAGAAPRERELPPTPALSFTPEALVLYRSWLSPVGASYEGLALVRLSAV